MNSESKEIQNSINKADVRQIEKESRDKLNELVNVNTLPNDPLERMETARYRLKELRRYSVCADRKTCRDAIQIMAKELLRSEQNHIRREIDKAEKVDDKEHKAWIVRLNASWVEFLKKVKAEEAIKKQNFTIDWMELSNSQRAKVEAKTGLAPKQKERALDMIDKDEDDMIKEIEDMALEIHEISSEKKL